MRNEKYKLYFNTNRKPEKFYDLLNDPFERNNLINSINNSDRKSNFDKLTNLIVIFPLKDSDPKYYPNPSQFWDVEISAESQIWKK